MPRTTPGGSPASWASRSTSWTWSASSRRASCGPFVDGYLDGPDAQPVHRLQHARSSSGRSWAGRGTLYGCEAVATGHYARVRASPTPATGRPRYELLAGVDPDKDQSYFLYGLRQDQLAHTRFPLGDLTKPEVRAIAHELGLATAAKPESQELCFVPGGDIGEALARAGGWQPQPGRVLDADGRDAGQPRRARRHTRSASGPASASHSASASTSRPWTWPPTSSSWAAARTSSRDAFELDAAEPDRRSTHPPTRSGRSSASDTAATLVPAHRSSHRALPRSERWQRPAGADGLGPGARPGGGAVRRRRNPTGSSAAAASPSDVAGRPRPPPGSDSSAQPPERGTARPAGRPAVVLSILVGVFNSCLYVVLRGVVRRPPARRRARVRSSVPSSGRRSAVGSAIRSRWATTASPGHR